MIEFLLDNNIAISAGLLAAIKTWRLCSDLLLKKDTPDDWFEQANYINLAKKYGKRHQDFIGQHIEFDRDRSIIIPNRDNDGHIRIFKD